MTEPFTDLNLWGLFTSAFISSTLLPGGSEAWLAYLDAQMQHQAAVLLLVATAGNTLGGMTSWAIGYWLGKRYPGKQLEQKNRNALQRLRRWGSPVLLLSWVPVIGDPLCVVAGWLKIGFWRSLIFIATGKATRYAVILMFV